MSSSEQIMQDMTEALNAFDKIASTKLIPSVHMLVHGQYRFPRSGKRRIRKKWTKDLSNWKQIPSSTAYHVAGLGLVAHPKTIERITKSLLRTCTKKSGKI